MIGHVNFLLYKLSLFQVHGDARRDNEPSIVWNDATILINAVL
jgi:hypothetical protein